MKNKVLIIIVLAIFITGAVGLIVLDRQLPNNSMNDTTTTTPTLTNSVVASTSTYYIPEMGVRFAYPAYATVTVDVLPGTTGEAVVGVVHLKSEAEVLFGGLTPDYTKPRGRAVTDTMGYFTDDDGSYYYRYPPNPNVKPSLIPVAYTLETTDGGTAIVITDPEYVGPGGIEAILNTKSTRFPGIIFSGEAKTSENRALFESIVRSVVLE